MDHAGRAVDTHNILKTHRYRTWRDPHGTWRLLRPGSTDIHAT